MLQAMMSLDYRKSSKIIIAMKINKNHFYRAFYNVIVTLVSFWISPYCFASSIKITENAHPVHWRTVEVEKPSNIVLKIGVQYVGNNEACKRFELDHYLDGADKHSPSFTDWHIFGRDIKNSTVKLSLDKYTPDQCGMRSVAVISAQWDPSYQTEKTSSKSEFFVTQAGMASWERNFVCHREMFALGPQLFCWENSHSQVNLSRDQATIKMTYKNVE